MLRPLLAPVLVAASLIAAPAAATPPADTARPDSVRIAMPAQPPRPAARTALPRRTRYALQRIMARNFEALGRRQLDTLVASVL